MPRKANADTKVQTSFLRSNISGQKCKPRPLQPFHFLSVMALTKKRLFKVLWSSFDRWKYKGRDGKRTFIIVWRRNFI